MNEVQIKFKTSLGNMYISGTGDFISKVAWSKIDCSMAKEGQNLLAIKLINSAYFQINEYIDNKRKKFDLPLNYQGTTFQEEVWKELLKIPFGETRSYQDIASAIKRLNAVRAVGSANGKNPLCILIPCHRVISKSGKISGYVGGEKIKKKLLDIEVSNFL